MFLVLRSSIVGIKIIHFCYNSQMSIDFMYIAIVLVIVFSSMVLHELMHGMVAYWLGDDTAKENGRLTLNPIRHIDPFMTILLPVILAALSSFMPGTPIFGGAKPVPFRPDRLKGGEWGAALVGIAGPITNLLLAFLFFLIAHMTGNIIVIDGATFFAAGNAFSDFLAAGVMVNLGFFAFNILPIPPLDGSRLLYAVAPPSVQRFLQGIENLGVLVIFSIVLVASNLLGNILGVIINGMLNVFMLILPL